MLDLSENLKTSKGDAMTDPSSGTTKSLANILCEHIETASSQDVSVDDFGRFWEIAKSLAKTGMVELADVELRKLSDFIKKSPRMPLLIRAQLDEAIEQYRLSLSVASKTTSN